MRMCGRSSRSRATLSSPGVRGPTSRDWIVGVVPPTVVPCAPVTLPGCRMKTNYLLLLSQMSGDIIVVVVAFFFFYF